MMVEKKPRRKSPVNTVTTEQQYCSIDLRLKILSRLPFFEGLDRPAIEDINRRFVENGYQAGARIYHAGDAAERLFVVADGKVKLLQHAPGGRDVLLDLLASGEFFGSLAGLGAGSSVYADTAQAQTSACVLSVRAEDFRAILDAHPQVTLRVLSLMAELLQAANQRVLQMAAMPVEQRIADTLGRLAKKFGRPQEQGLLVDVPLSRADLAEMTGATTETVSRVMSQLQSDGIIQSGRQWVAVVDPDRLAELAGTEG